jgi:hypothetical protein
MEPASSPSTGVSIEESPEAEEKSPKAKATKTKKTSK